MPLTVSDIKIPPLELLVSKKAISALGAVHCLGRNLLEQEDGDPGYCNKPPGHHNSDREHPKANDEPLADARWLFC
jgi:hypothetical protein